MKVFILKDDSSERKAFIKISGSSYLICIGTEKQVDEATADQLWVMVQTALAHAVYESMTAQQAIKH